MCARAPPASTVGVLTAAATSWVVNRASRGARRSGAQRRGAFPWARHWQLSRARPLSTRSTRFGATGALLPLHLAPCTASQFSSRAGCATLLGWAPRTGASLCKAPSSSISIIHGYFYWRESDTNGTFGAWWVPLRRIVKQLGKEYVEEKLQEFEQEMERMKTDAIARALEGDASGDEQ